MGGGGLKYTTVRTQLDKLFATVENRTRSSGNEDVAVGFDFELTLQRRKFGKIVIISESRL
jgi:hypothetical protein